MASLSIEEENYVRLSLLLTGVSPRAVRSFFDKDKDLAPAALPATVQREKQKLLGLKGKKIINGAQWNMLHPANGIPDSNNFDVTLMICLLRNLTKIVPPMFGFDCVPLPGETTEGADLARIKYYRNALAHLDDTKIDTPKFTTAWTNVADAVERLGGQLMVQECQELKVKILDQSNKEIMVEIKQSQTEMNELQKSIQEISKEVDTQKATHSELKLAYKKEIENLTESYSSLKTDGEEKTKEVENLAKSYVNLTSDHEEKNKEVEKLAMSYVSLKTDHEKKNKEVEILAKSYVSLKTEHETLAKSHVTLKTDHEEKTKEVEKLAKYYVSLKTDHEEKTIEVEHLAQSYLSLKTVHDEKIKEIDNLKANHEDVVPWNVRGQIKNNIEKWKKDDAMFIVTRAAKRVIEYVKTKSCVTVTGSSGTGKTFTVRHVALQLAGEGYDIIPVINPDDIRNFHNPNKKTIFVIDDFCGKYALNQNVFDRWKSLSDTIIYILEDKVTQIIVSCRSQVYQDDLFKTLLIFTSCECNLMSKELCLLDIERQSLAELYLKEDASKVRKYLNMYDCFPLLCKLYKENPNLGVIELFKNPFSVYETEFSKLWTERADGKYCALALCVMFNNHLKEQWLTEDIDKDTKTIIENTCEACKLERGLSRLIIRDELESLTNTFIRKDALVEIKGDEWSQSTRTSFGCKTLNDKQDNFYCTIHDKLFDYMVSYFGKVMISTLIKNGDRRLIAERFLFQEANNDMFSIIIPGKYQKMYLDRIISDWVKGHVSHVFNNINMKKRHFREILLKYLRNYDQSFQKKLAEMCDMTYKTTDKLYEISWWKKYSTTTPLVHYCLIGDINMVQWLCGHGSDVNHCNSKRESPLYMACMKGHLGVATVLLENQADVNLCTVWKKSPLYKACAEGYTDIVITLLNYNADVNQCTDWGASPLFIACNGGYAEIVTHLVKKKADVNQCTYEGESLLYIACYRRYTEIVSILLDNGANVNQCTFGESPLYVACKGGYTEIVTNLLEHEADVNQCNEWGESPLYISCRVGYADIVTKLLDYGADVNQCTYERESPLHVACLGEFTEVVTLLLDKEADVNHYSANGKSPLNIAATGGYTETLTKLLMNKAWQCVNQQEKNE